MGNHCVPMACPVCGEEYCVRCESGVCPRCGTPWDAKPMSVDDYIKSLKKKRRYMTLTEIYQATCLLRKSDKVKLVNMILASMGERTPRKEITDNDPTYPVHEAMCVFDGFVLSAKGVRYSPNGLFQNLDYRHMRELLVKLDARMMESGVEMIDDDRRIETLRSFLQAVRDMRNTWYFDNRFTPAGLNTDFDKIYIALKTQNNHGHQSAFSYL